MLRAVKLGRILSLLVALAVLIAPAGMMRADAAMPDHDMAAAAPMDHCAGQSAPDEKQKPPESCCVVACATFIALPAELAAPAVPSIRHRMLVSAVHHGLAPEAATPPPRSS